MPPSSLPANLLPNPSNPEEWIAIVEAEAVRAIRAVKQVSPLAPVLPGLWILTPDAQLVVKLMDPRDARDLLRQMLPERHALAYVFVYDSFVEDPSGRHDAILTVQATRTTPPIGLAYVYVATPFGVQFGDVPHRSDEAVVDYASLFGPA